MKVKCSIPIKHDGKTYGIGEVIELKDIEFVKAYITHIIEDEEKEELSNEQGYQGKENSNQNLENKTVKELREIAKEKEVVGYGNMNKAELIAALER